ncbi:MAG: HDOD domain-containing protein [Desulfobulbus sp.]|jgi:putative nucleotidyltransferase with HDIG domain|nr:HDOD domain-containing protein [Desulfobulbus sp.]
MDNRTSKLEKIRLVVDKMPSLSTTVSKVLEICSRPDTVPNDLNKVISLDPVLAGQVLRLTNSAYYSLVNKVTSLTRAIVMLGLNTVKNLALSTAIIRTVGQAKKSQALPIREFWAHSIAVGATAKLLAAARDLSLVEREEYFVAGLLHDLGKVPLADEYTEVFARVNTGQEPLVTVEQQILKLDHQEVGAMIAAKWKLNAVITDAICHHHTPTLAGHEHRDLVATVALADFFVCLFDIGNGGNHYPDPTGLESLLQQCGIEWYSVVDLATSVEAEILKAETFLQI